MIGTHGAPGGHATFGNNAPGSSDGGVDVVVWQVYRSQAGGQPGTPAGGQLHEPARSEEGEQGSACASGTITATVAAAATALAAMSTSIRLISRR